MTYLSLIGLPPLDWVRTANLATGYCTVFDSVIVLFFCVCCSFSCFFKIYIMIVLFRSGYCTVFEPRAMLPLVHVKLQLCSCAGARAQAQPALPGCCLLTFHCKLVRFLPDPTHRLTLVRTRTQANPPALPPISVRPSSGPTQRVQLPTSRKTCANGAANGAAPAQPATQVPAANGAAVAAAANGMCPAAAMTPIKLPCSGDELFEVTVQVIKP